jgi:hypothetical protein
VKAAALERTIGAIAAEDRAADIGAGLERGAVADHALGGLVVRDQPTVAVLDEDPVRMPIEHGERERAIGARMPVDPLVLNHNNPPCSVCECRRRTTPAANRGVNCTVRRHKFNSHPQAGGAGRA